MKELEPVVSAEEIFAVDKRIRWMALTTDRGDVILCQMRPSTQPYSPQDSDIEFVKLGPLTLLGIAEKYSQYLKGVDCVVVYYGLVVCVYARLGSQVISVAIEKEIEPVSKFLSWLENKRSKKYD